MADAEQTARAFKTGWFAKAARKARIKDAELFEALQEVIKGQADDLGGGLGEVCHHEGVMIGAGRLQGEAAQEGMVEIRALQP